MATPTATLVQKKSDALVLAELQDLGTSVGITGYDSTNGSPNVTWADAPGSLDENAILAYFQQNNHLAVFSS